MSTRYLSARRVAWKLSIPWKDLEPLLEQAGADIIRFGTRIRVAEADVERFVAQSRQQPLAATVARGDTILDLALQRMGIEPKPRRRKAGVA